MDKPSLDPRYPIETERLSLRPFEAGDLDVLHRLQSLPEVVRYLRWGSRSRAEVAAVLEERIHQSRIITAEGGTLILALTLRDGEALIGDVNLQLLSAADQQGKFGFVLLPEYHGQGYGREAAMATLALGFDTMSLHRIAGYCDARNTASVRLMERLGMRREAHFREISRSKGEWADLYIYAMLAAEWRASKAQA
jgi:RimJ/RimL family protein N-acetyltransferase